MMAERFLYLPSVGFAMAVSALVYRVPLPQVRVAFLAVTIALFAVRLYARNLAWQDDLTLASTDVQTAPHKSSSCTRFSRKLSPSRTHKAIWIE